MPRLSPSAAGALAVCLAAAGLVAGCRKETPPPLPPPPLADAPDTSLSAVTDTAAAGAEARTGTMRVEGVDRSVALTAFDADGVPFTTYVPRGEFETRTSSGGGQTTVAFAWTAERGASGEPSATVTVAAPGVSPDSLLTAFVREGAAQGRTVADAGASPCLWAVEGHAFTDEVSGMTGIVCVGSHRGRAFRLTTEADAERADGFAARLDVILREWRWRDTGLGLEDAAAL